MIPRPRLSGWTVELAFLITAAVLLVLALTALLASGPAAVADQNQDSANHVTENGTQFAPASEFARESPTVSSATGTATVDGSTYDSLQRALEAANPGDYIALEGTFEEQIVVETSDVELRGEESGAVIDGGHQGHVVNVSADNVTIADLWIRGSGADSGNEDAGVFVDGNDTTLESLHLTDVLWGVWIDGVDRVTVVDSYVEGRSDVFPLVERGNGIHLWDSNDTVLVDNQLVSVRDGIYYSWANHVYAANNTIVDSRYGVHYMYSNDNRLVNNTAIGNDVGYALMVSRNLEIVGNEAFDNAGASGHGILVKDIDRTVIRDNTLVGNRNGLYVYNSHENEIAGNLLIENQVGIVSTAGSDRQHVVNNSLINNLSPVEVTTQAQQAWNGSSVGNYWSSARPIDVTGNGISEVAYRPAGLLTEIREENPQAEIFAGSPAFDAVRLAESSFPVIESAGVIDHHPRTEPAHEDWREYLEEDT